MANSIEITQLIRGGTSAGEDLRRAEQLRTEFLSSDPDDPATTQGGQGERLTITSGGKPLTVGQVQAELQILVLGE